MQASCNCSTVVDKVSTGLCHQQNLGHDSRGYTGPAINKTLGMILEVYTNMIKSNFTVLNNICVHTNHVC